MTPVPGGLDWATQPDPFRRFASAPQVDLPLLAGELPARWDDLFRPHGVPAWAFDLDTLAALLQRSLGLSAWKSHAGSRWALRCNPSSGNLHPNEGYLISPALPGLAPTLGSITINPSSAALSSAPRRRCLDLVIPRA